MNMKKLCTISIMAMLVTSGLLAFQMNSSTGDIVFKQIQGLVNDAPGPVRAWDATQNGEVYYYIQNRTNEGSGTDPMNDNSGQSYYDPAISEGITDWIPGDECIIVVNRDFGSYGVDHAGYLAFQNVLLDDTGVQIAPTIDLQKIPTPSIVDNGSDYIEIDWPAITDPNGIVAGYTVYRSTTNGTVSGDADWTLIGGTVNAPIVGTTFNDTLVSGGVTYYYSLKIVFIGYTNDIPGNVDNYECTVFGEGSGMMEAPAPPATVDYIIITDASFGVGPVDLGVGQSIMLYARGYNDTSGYIGLVEVDWSRLPVEGSLDTATGQTSTYTAGMNGAAVTVTGTNSSNPSWTDDFIINILPPTVDYIEITDGAGGPNLLGGPVPVGFQEWGTCSGYNITSGYIGTFSADWTVEGGTAKDLGFTPDITHGIDVNMTDVSVWLNASYGGFTDSVQYDVQTPTVDYIAITIDALGLSTLPGGSVPVGYQDWGFAAAYNNTVGFLYLVSADWTVEGVTASDLGITPDITHGIDVGLTGGISVWLNASWGGFSDSVQYDIDLPTIDYIDITEDALGLITLGDKNPGVGFQEMGYAAGYNTTSGFVSLVSADWAVEGGSASPLGSTPDTTHGIDVGLTDVTVYLNASYGGFTDSVQYTVLTPTVDYIDITEDDLGLNPLAGGLVISPFIQWGNCSAYNNTAGFLYLVTAVWTVEGGDASPLGSTPDVTHGINVGTIPEFVWLNASFGGFLDSVQYEISSYTIDYIVITSDPGGMFPISDSSPPVGFQEWGYAAAWNDSAGFLSLVSAEWTVTGGAATDLGTTPNTFHGIDVGLTGGVSVFLTADFGGFSDSVQYDVLPPTVDYIDITVDILGVTPVTDKNVPVGFQEWGFAAGYNNTVGFVQLVSAVWVVAGGSASPLGSTPDTTHGINVGNSGVTVTLTADFGGSIDVVTYNVIPPTVDYIDITVDALGVTPVTDKNVPVGFQEWGFCAGYNTTSGFVSLVSADWTFGGSAVGLLGPTPGTSNGIDVGLTGGVSVWLNASFGGFTDSVQYDIIPLTIDYIDITVDTLGVTPLAGGSVPVGFQEWGYAAGYNTTSGFVQLVSADWTVEGGDASALGSTPDTTHGINVGIINVVVYINASYSGYTDSVQYTVQVGTIDYIDITVDNMGVTSVGDKSVGVAFQEWGYAAGYNLTSGFVSLVTADWSVSGGDATLLSVTPAQQNGIGVGTTVVTVTLDADYLGLTDTVTYIVLTPTIDDIVIRDTSGNGGLPIWFDYPTYPSFTLYDVGETDTFWAAGYNASIGYINDVTVTWETWDTLITMQDTSNGTVSPTSGVSTTFTANSLHGGALIVRAEYSAGVFNFTNILVIFNPFPNYIVIMDGPGGIGGGANIAGDKTYNGGETETFYAAGYNYTAGYIGDIEVDWATTDSSVGDIDVTTGIWTNFTAQALSSDGTCRITADDSGAANNITGVLTVLASVPVMDYITIMDAADNLGSPVGDMTYGVYDFDFFYAAAFNTTSGYIQDVDATWSSDDTTVGQMDATLPPARFDAQEVPTDDSCIVTATYNSMTDTTGTLTVLAPTVDDIQIRNAPGGGGSIVGDRTFGVGDSDEFYASAYNDTIGYIGEVTVTWTILPTTGVGTVDTTGVYTNFTALLVSTDSTCTVTANYQGVTNITGTLTVLKPTVDEIRIRDAVGGLGTVLDTDITMDVDDFHDYYAAGYNATVGYLRDLTGASWSVSNIFVGSVSPASGVSTTFTADAVGTVRIEVSAEGVSNESAEIEVQSAVVEKPPQPQPLELVTDGQSVIIGVIKLLETNIDEYVIQRATSSDGPWDNVTRLDADQFILIYTDDDLDPDTKYYYRVVAVDDAGLESEPSVVESITTDPDDAFPWLLLILLIIIVVVILLIVLMMAKKKKPEEEMPPGAMPGAEAPMEEAPMEEEFVEEGYKEGGEAEETYEEEPQYEEAPSEEVEYEEAPTEEVEYEEEPQVEEEEPDTSSTPPPPPPPPPA